MGWAVDNGYIVFTHDLDFGALIAVTRARGPSVIQVRAEDVLPESLGAVVLSAISRFRAELEKGALISLDPARARVRMLPIVESGADDVPDA
jgi:predicted nuclease of predicted toxin-antitoxin system